MICLSVNVQGLGGKEKKQWVRKLCHSNQVNFLSIQETKMVSFDVFVVKAFWGNTSFDFATSSARGRSGAILCVWDNTLFQKKRVYSNEHCLCVEGTWLWAYMADIISRWHGEVVAMGDFNEVRYASERHGSTFYASNAVKFNMFIVNSHLNEIPLGGYSFTWSDKYVNKMSKLDHFLVSQGILDLFLNLSGLILHRNISDHGPILLKESHVDYGPTPFRLFHSWFLEDDFTSVIEDSWNNNGIIAPNPMILLKNKLKSLKQRLKTWSSEKKGIKDHDRKRLQDTLIAIDLRLDQDVCLPGDLLNRANIVRDLQAINKKESVDLAQKAKVKWAIEGDENTKFFHGIVNKKRRHLAIKGILINGEWIDNPIRVKSEFYNHFANRFSAPNWTRVPFDDQFPSCLNIDHSCDLERDVTIEEIKRAVWDCCSDKSPGPDGFTFEFFKKYWSIVGNDVVNVVKEFFSSSTFPNRCNPSFIALILKVLDAKHLNDFRLISLVGCQYKIIGNILANRLSLVIDDIISQEQSAFVKGRKIIDGPIILNEKAFDSVRWDHLDDILGKFGFGNKWRGWIQGCLLSSKASVLVNGSPTDEFTFHREVCPLSSLLVMIIWFPSRIYSTPMMQCLLERCENVNVLMMMLHCFFLASGLKINVQKSSIFGVGVRSSDVHSMVVRYGCLASTLPFTYLGVKVGANMKRVNSWSEVVKKVTSKLSTWKAKTLSVGGRLTLIKSVLGAILTYYMSLFKAPEGVLKHLEIIHNSFFLGADLGERKITWAIYGNEGSLDHFSSSHHGCSVWSGILKAVDKLKIKGVDLNNFCKLVVGNVTSAVSSFFTPTRWSKVLPIKLNVFMWRMLLDKLPTRSNLAIRGLDVPCSLCPNCGMGVVYPVSLLFFVCPMALDLFRLLGRWWNIQIPILLDPST
ncbi:RNA-directed DNA polymerase, eukaryota [Tanacetum coccineum]|uniref:RNA-directed DNA polymerase, eukaryota n=1 Tax=Tanacetum coccineum TaxID=301880 RepID=A0ABQ5IUW2_9ASTR